MNEDAIRFLCKFLYWQNQIGFIIHGALSREKAELYCLYFSASEKNTDENNPNNSNNYSQLSGNFFFIIFNLFIFS